MREETVGDFRRIAVRMVVSGELRPLAEFLNGVEFGPRRLSIPFLEISRRGAVLRGQSARSLAATIEVNAFLQGSDGDEGKAGTPEAGAAAAEGGTNAEASPAASPGAPGLAPRPPRAGKEGGPHRKGHPRNPA